MANTTKGALTKTQKVFIVERLALFATKEDVCKEFEEEFGRSISRQGVWIYDAAKPHVRCRMSKELVQIFDDVRARFRAEVEDVPIANKAFRLQTLDKLLRGVMKGDGAGKVNRPLAIEIIERAAKEMGDAYTNRREISGPGGGPIEMKAPVAPDLSSLSREQLDQLEAIRIAVDGPAVAS